MTQRKLCVGLALIPAFLAIGCAKTQAPQTTPPQALAVASTPKAAPEATPMVADETERPIELSLQELQRQLEEQGLFGDVFFEFDEADLLDTAKARLAKNAELMRSRPELAFTIGGHCDERGTNEYNIALGLRRASSAANYVSSLGVPAERLKTLSYGEDRPFCTLSAEECWQKNRRSQFTLTGRN